MPDSDDKKSSAWARDAWLNVLGVVHGAEHELQKAAHKVLESAGIDPNAESVRAEVVDRMRKNRDEFERRLDEGVKDAIARARAPIDKQLASVKARLERIQSKIDARRKR